LRVVLLPITAGAPAEPDIPVALPALPGLRGLFPTRLGGVGVAPPKAPAPGGGSFAGGVVVATAPAFVEPDTTPEAAFAPALLPATGALTSLPSFLVLLLPAATPPAGTLFLSGVVAVQTLFLHLIVPFTDPLHQ
jgi:hypothetical protein